MKTLLAAAICLFVVQVGFAQVDETIEETPSTTVEEIKEEGTSEIEATTPVETVPTVTGEGAEEAVDTEINATEPKEVETREEEAMPIPQ